MSQNLPFATRNYSFFIQWSNDIFHLVHSGGLAGLGATNILKLRSTLFYISDCNIFSFLKVILIFLPNGWLKVKLSGAPKISTRFVSYLTAHVGGGLWRRREVSREYAPLCGGELHWTKAILQVIWEFY